MKTFLQARGMQVATLQEGAQIGKLDDFLFELETGRIFGYRLKQGVIARTGGVAASALTLIGRDLVYVTSEASVDWTGLARRADEGRAWASQYRGSKVVSRRGASLGVVDDFVIEESPPAVKALLLDGNRLVRLDERVSTGRDAVILDEPSVALALEDDEPETTDWWIRVRGAFGREKKDEKKEP
jgi:uncharacterized protein YrrD